MSKEGRAGAALGLLRIETRRGAALLLSPFILAAAYWMSWNGLYGVMSEADYTNVYIWEETSRAVKDSILTTGPLAAGLAAWAAGRNRRRGMGDLLSTTARPAAHRDLLTWAGVALPFVAVYVLLVVLLGVPTFVNATWGNPIFGYFLVGIVALLMDAALGYAAGYWLPNRFTAPLVAVGLYVAHLLPMGASDYESGVGLLSPAAYSNMTGADVFHEVPPIAVQQTLLFGGLAAVALSSVVLKAGGRLAGRIALAASLSVTVVGLAASLASGNPYGYTTEEARTVPFEYACEEGGITVCVHPAYARLLPETARAVNEVAKPLVGLPAAPTRAVQIDNYVTPEDFEEETATFGYAGEMSKDEVAYSLVTDEEAMPDLPLTAEETKDTEKDLQRCGGSPDRRYFYPAYEAQSIVGDWLLERSGGSPSPMGSMSGCPNANELVERFDDLPSAARRAWLEDNLAGLRTGEVTLKDLP